MKIRNAALAALALTALMAYQAKAIDVSAGAGATNPTASPATGAAEGAGNIPPTNAGGVNVNAPGVGVQVERGPATGGAVMNPNAGANTNPPAPGMRTDGATPGNLGNSGSSMGTPSMEMRTNRETNVLGDNRPDQWRYKWENNRWWYWTPENRWMVYSEPSGWTYYEPAGSYTTGYGGVAVTPATPSTQYYAAPTTTYYYPSSGYYYYPGNYYYSSPGVYLGGRGWGVGIGGGWNRGYGWRR